ncbi:MAG: CarD family transcriptional regulator [candidate division KSB1 bacterium]|nr:CarD family transcriptional regulator [candidate division KSB1 bacterium]
MAQGLPGSSFAFLQTLLYLEEKRVFVSIFDNEQDAVQFRDDMSVLLPDDNILYYPAIGNQMWKELGPQGSVTGHRLAVLKALVSGEPCLVITTPDALLEKIFKPEWVKQQFIHLTLHTVRPFNSFIKNLIKMGFVREDRVDRPGEMSVRGGIVDVFLFESTHPYRIEFFGDEVDSMRKFDVETQQSLEPCSELYIIPPFAGGNFTPPEEMPLLDYPQDSTLFEYCDPFVFIHNSQLCGAQADEVKGVRDMQVREHDENVDYEDYYWLPEQLDHHIERNAVCKIEPVSISNKGIQFPFFENNRFGGNLALFKTLVDKLYNQNIVATLLCESESQRKRLQDLFEQEEFPPLDFKTLNVARGFHWPDEGVYVYTNREIYSRIRFPKPDKLDKRQIALRQQLQINKGDYIVHEEHGIGLFKGLTMIKAYGKERECLVVEYKDQDKLYVPLEKMDQVQKYSSRDGVVPVLNKLGTAQWEKLKTRTKKRMKEVAEQLIKLYATRKARTGYTFSEDTIWQKELEASFQFEETYDQLNAVTEIKQDMQKNQPMDRLICGDVGYGKTEVAVRAAFKAINDGKQVCVLVPTTILAQQHYETFVERIQSFPCGYRSVITV